MPLRCLWMLPLLMLACDSPGDGTPSPATADTSTAADGSSVSGDTGGRVPDAGGAPELPPAGGPCPPGGPFGTAIGDTLADVTVYDCDGNPWQLSNLCGNDASLVVTWAGWCNACTAYTEMLANDIYATITDGPETVGAALVITEKADFSQPDATYCAQVRDEYQLTMPVFYDPGDTIEDTWGVSTNSQEVVLEKGMKLFWKNGQGGFWSHPDSVNEVRAVLNAL